MAEIPDIVLKKINDLLHILKDNKINVAKSYLFGSFASGKYDEWSDIDLAIVSDDFTGNTYQDKINLIDYIYQAGRDISPLPYKVEDFENSFFVKEEIIKKGIQII